MPDRSYRLVVISSRLRVGSTWAFNVARHLAQRAGYAPKPDVIPHGHQGKIAAMRAGLADPAPSHYWVVKTHLVVEDNPALKLIVPMRDPRDAFVSVMRFLGYDFDTALTHARGQLDETAYEDRPDARRLFLDYAAINERPAEAARQVADFLALEADDAAIDGAVQRFSKAAISKFVARLTPEMAGKARNLRVLQGSRGDPRVHDRLTGFQSRHVTGYRDGEWREALTPEQIEALHAAIPGPIAAWERLRERAGA